MTKANYSILVQESALPYIREDFDESYFRHDGAYALYHCDVRTYLEENLLNKDVARRDSCRILCPLFFFKKTL